MNGIPPSIVTLGPAPADFYPSSDGEPMAETEAHLLAMLWLIATLRLRYEDRPTVFVVGNVFFYYEEGNPLARKAPDVMVVKGVEPRDHRLSFKTWEEGAVPCAIFELTSPSTAEEDRSEKFDLYQRLGIKEYFLFDPLDQYLEPRLQGYVLMPGGTYEPLMQAADGSVFSNQLQLRLRPEGRELALYDAVTQKRLPTPPETHRLWRETQAQLEAANRVIEEEHQRADEAERLAAHERKRADEAERLAADEHKRAEEAQRVAAEASRLATEANRLATEEHKRADEAERLAAAERKRADEAVAELARFRALLAPPDEGTSS